MDLSNLLNIVDRITREGDAVIEQLESVLGGEPLEDQNPNALDRIGDMLAGIASLARGEDFADEALVLADEIDEFLDN